MPHAARCQRHRGKTRLLVHLLGYNFIAFASALTCHTTADYQNNIAKAEAKKKA